MLLDATGNLTTLAGDGAGVCDADITDWLGVRFIVATKGLDAQEAEDGKAGASGLSVGCGVLERS